MATTQHPRPLSHLLRTLCVPATVFALSTSGFAAEVAKWTIDEGGGPQEFSLVDDEVQVRHPSQGGGELQSTIAAAIPGSVAIQTRGRTVLVKLPTTIARQQSVARTRVVESRLPASEIAPVLYQNDLPAGTSAARRIVTKQVLAKVPEGGNGEALKAQAGAAAAIATNIANRVRLVFKDPYAALDGAARLRAGGIEAEPMLAREMQLRAIPNDPFFPDQWHLRNIGQGGGTFGIDANVVRAWDITKGAFQGVAPINIGIIDDGLETTHPDLAPNCFPVSTNFNYDFNDQDNNPGPDPISFDAHGTAVGGVAAARGDNSIGVSGSAPLAKMVGLRLIAGPFTDADGAAAFTWQPIGFAMDASNNSWGPADGSGVAGPRTLERQALEDAAKLGRNGKGIVTVFAAGNGLLLNDNANFDGYANSRYVLAVSAVDNTGVQAFYSEPGTNILVCAPSNGGSLGIFTTDVTFNRGFNPGPGEPADQSYTNSFGGTSSAAPLVTGGVALVLSANPSLTWRDVHEILASTARQNDDLDSDWNDNGAGFHFNQKYGAGMVDFTAAVVRARDWTLLTAEQSVTNSTPAPAIPGAGVPIPDNGVVTRTFTFTGSDIRIERVALDIAVTHARRDDIEIILTSPSGMVSPLVPVEAQPPGSNFGSVTTPLTFTSTHHWGEDSDGVWTLSVADRRTGTTGTLRYAALSLYGTTQTSTQRFAFDKQAQQVSESLPNAVITVNRLGGSTGTSTIDYAISADSSAVSGLDFTGPLTGTLTFPDGVLSQDITIPLVNDPDSESTEEIFVLLKNPTNSALGGITLHTLSVIDDEVPAVNVTVSDNDAGETIAGLQSPNPGEFTISRTSTTDLPLTVNFTITGSAVAGADYVAFSSPVVIPAGEASVTIPVDVLDDLLTEGNDTVTVEITPDVSYILGAQSMATLIVKDNDSPSIEVFVSPAAVIENAGTMVNFTVTRNGDTTLPITVGLNVFGTAILGENYGPSVPNNVIIPAGQRSAVVQVAPLDNANYSATTNLIVQVSPSPGYNDGFSSKARLTILDDEPLPDSKPPTVQILAPKNGTKFPALPILANGTAADNEQVVLVRYRVDHGGIVGALKPATLTPPATPGAPYTWTADLSADAAPGPNFLAVQSVDALGNVSPFKNVNFNYVIPHTLTVPAAAGGTVSAGFSPSSLRDAGVTYSITANPQPGFVFNGWTGLVTSPSRTITFTMPDADATLTPAFILSPFSNPPLPLAGNYAGVFREMALSPATAGLIQATLSKTAAFTAKIFLGGRTHKFKGEFTGSGNYQGKVSRPNDTPLFLTLALDMTGVSGQITGTVSDGLFNSTLAADRAFYDSRLQPYVPGSPNKQSFTFAQLPPAMPAALDPLGTGAGTLTINSSGVVKWSARLGDHSYTKQTARLSKTNTFPFHASLYGGLGIFAANATVDPGQPTTDLHATGDWTKLPSLKQTDFPGGFTLTGLQIQGSIYLPPPSGTRAFPGLADTASNTIATLSEGRLSTPIVQPLTWDAGNKIAVVTPGMDQLTLSLTIKSGLLNGSFLHPISVKKTPIEAVLLQKSGQVLGNFRGTDFGSTNPQTGTLNIVPSP